jgi:hypothetical protein
VTASFYPKHNKVNLPLSTMHRGIEFDTIPKNQKTWNLTTKIKAFQKTSLGPNL